MKSGFTEFRAKLPLISLKSRLSLNDTWVSACVFSFWLCMKPGPFIFSKADILSGGFQLMQDRLQQWYSLSEQVSLLKFYFPVAFSREDSPVSAIVAELTLQPFFFSGIWILFSIPLFSHLPFLKRKPVTNWCLWGLYFVQLCWNWLAFELYWNWRLM